MAKRKQDKALAVRLGRNIADSRKRTGLTQAKLAERLGVDTETVSRFERGVTLPSLPTLERIASQLNTSIGELVSATSIQPAELAATITAWLKQLSDKDRIFVIESIKNLCKHLS